MFLATCENFRRSKPVEEVSINIFEDQVSMNIHFKPGVIKYIKIEIPL